MAATYPAVLCEAYLSAMERKELEAARRYLAPDFHAVWPGGRIFRTVVEIATSGEGRYSNVRKCIERVWVADEAEAAGCGVVLAGTLRGVWCTGERFEDVRFTDMFVVQSELIREQRVWNDLSIFEPR